MKIGLEWEGRTIWFPLRFAGLAIRAGLALRLAEIPHKWKFKKD